jgi:transcriptional regulator with XRE-family HTH domain
MTEAWSGGGSTALRMVLGRQLQALRERAGLSFERAGAAIYVSHSTIRRMEKGEGTLNRLKLKGLLAAYGVTDGGEIDSFLTLAEEASKPGWWHRFSDVLPPWFRTYVGLEEAASLIRGYEPFFVPGLLQTEDYARALMVAGFSDAPAAEIERRAGLRIARQGLLTRPNPPRLWFVLDEAVLRRPAGGRRAMRAQIEHLIEAAALPNVTLQVLPFASGPHPAMGLFHIFRFPSPELPDLLYTECLTGALYIDKQHELAGYLEALDHICHLAETADRSVTILTETLKEM